MNAFVQATPQEQQELSLRLVGQNFTTGQSYCRSFIPLDFFAKALENGHEIEIQSLEINGFNFSGNEISGYNELHDFISQLNQDNNSQKVAVFHAVLMEAGLVSLEDLFEFVEKKVLAHSLDSSEFGLSDLREVYGQNRSNEALDQICTRLPSAQAQQLALYWNHQQFVDDLFINDCHFIHRGKVQVILSNR